MKKRTLGIFLSVVIIFQLAYIIFLQLLLNEDSKSKEVASYTTRDSAYSLSLTKIGNDWPFSDEEVEIRVIKHGIDFNENHPYFRIILQNNLNWSALSTLKFTEIDGGINLCVKQGENENEITYNILWSNIFH